MARGRRLRLRLLRPRLDGQLYARARAIVLWNPNPNPDPDPDPNPDPNPKPDPTLTPTRTRTPSPSPSPTLPLPLPLPLTLTLTRCDHPAHAHCGCPAPLQPTVPPITPTPSTTGTCVARPCAGAHAARSLWDQPRSRRSTSRRPCRTSSSSTRPARAAADARCTNRSARFKPLPLPLHCKVTVKTVTADPFFFGKGSLLRNEPQYPTKGYAPHSGRGCEGSY